MVRQWQKLFYGKRYGMTNLRSGALYRRTQGKEMPEYTPDFVKPVSYTHLDVYKRQIYNHVQGYPG